MYRHLFGNHTLSNAICRARQELYNDKERQAYFSQLISLEDWLLPVVYQHKSLQLSPRRMTFEEETRFYERLAHRYQAQQPTYGFVGRDLDILQIEKCLLTKHNIVLVRGMGGAGKTILLHHLGTWWQVTGFIDRVFYFGYDEKAWNPQQIITTIAQQLYALADYQDRFQPKSLATQQAMLVRKLCAERHLLIFDNLESVTEDSFATQHSLSRKEQEQLRQFLAGLANGRTLILLGSRGDEKWLAEETFADTIHYLGGLDKEAATVLTERILQKYNVMHYLQDKDLNTLIELLDGYPLALEVVLSNLQTQTPKEVLTALQEGNVTLNAGDSQERTKNILRCIEYSYNNLPTDIQALLFCLAPFTLNILKIHFEPYIQCLKQQPNLATLPFERWETMIQEAMNWGLLSADSDFPESLRVQPTLPYFLRARWRESKYVEKKLAIENGFREYYTKLASLLKDLLVSKKSEEKLAGQRLIKLEYENLVTALDLALNAQASVIHLYEALDQYLDRTQDHQQGLDLGQKTLAKLQTYPPEKLAGSGRFDLAIVIDTIAYRQFHLKQYHTAEMLYQQALEAFQSLKTSDETRWARHVASIYHQLGFIAQTEHNLTKAEEYYKQSLQIKVEYNIHYELARTYHQLGILAYQQNHLLQAEEYYQHALQIYQEHQDPYMLASTSFQLGDLARRQGHGQQAEMYYQQSLQIYKQHEDNYEQARVYLRLGECAYEQQNWLRAREYYQNALQIYIERNDIDMQGIVYFQLGVMHEEMSTFRFGQIDYKRHHWQQAEDYCQRALKIFSESNNANNHHMQAGAYYLLGRLAHMQDHRQQAEKYYHHALQNSSPLGDLHKPDIYYHLGELAQKQRRWLEAQTYYQQALKGYTEQDNYDGQAYMFLQLGLTAQEQQHWPQARDYLLEALKRFVDSENRIVIHLQSFEQLWRSLAQIWQASSDSAIPTAIAPFLHMTPDEAENQLRKVLQDESD